MSVSSSSSSTIGKNSDDEGGENEAETPYKGPLDMMESLEEVLPIRRGISKFYKGKSKSFTSLTEAESSPMNDVGRPENRYSRRRRNLLSHRISKKPVKTLPMAMRQKKEDSSSSPRNHLQPPLHPRQSTGSFANCVPVVSAAASRNIHNNIIC